MLILYLIVQLISDIIDVNASISTEFNNTAYQFIFIAIPVISVILDLLSLPKLISYRFGADKNKPKSI